jgi:hypothetical protein
MIPELRLFKGHAIGHKPVKVHRFTWWTCKGNPLDYADRLAIPSPCRSMQLLQRHYNGRMADYGYGRGYEPIMVGTI